nr:family 16 glycosylhydrolase [uncultured Bacteroides sp.]
MKNIGKWIAGLCILTIAVSFSACKDDEDGYKGNLDLSLLCLKQAKDSWNGAESNISMKIAESAKADTVIDLTLALYQNKVATQDATVDIVLNKDSLATLISEAEKGGKYEKARLLPDGYYELSSTKLSISAGEKESSAVKLTIHKEKLLADDIVKRNGIFVLPLKIQSSTSYAINNKVNAVMLMFRFADFDETKPDPAAPEEEKDGMKLLWSDEFNNTGAPNVNYWNFEKGFVRNEELQWYQGENAECKEGALVISGKKERISNPNYVAGSSSWKTNREYAEYTSTSMTTHSKFDFQYGRLEVRAKIPTAKGAWPAIWTLGNWYDWPSCGEIDVLEYYLVGGEPHILANTAWGTDQAWTAKWNSVKTKFSEFVAKDADWAKKYHIWRMDWDANEINLYVDDVLYNTTKQSQTQNGSAANYTWPFKQKHYVLLNLAIGGNGGTPDATAFPMKYEVDYVRVYQKKVE